MSDDRRDSFIDELQDEPLEDFNAESEDGSLHDDPDEESDNDVGEESDPEPEAEMTSRKKRKIVKNMFIDDEAELSGDDAVSEDEDEKSDDDSVDLDLVDMEAPELDSDQEEEVRGLYHKQLEKEDRRAVMLMQEHLEEREVAIGQTRRRKFRWQTKELMDNSLRRHYDPDDDDSQGDDSDDDDIDYEDLKPKGLRRPTAESILLGSTRLAGKDTNLYPTTSLLDDESLSNSATDRIRSGHTNTASSIAQSSRSTVSQDLSRFVFRDKEIVQALSTKETIILTREEKEKNIQRELKKVLQSKSIFDQLYS